MNAAAVRAALAAAGYVCLAEDPVGAGTYAALAACAAGRALGALGPALGAGMADGFAGAGVASDLQIVHWIAQAAHETGGFRYLTELGDGAWFARYEGRAGLGNTQPGDGFRYRGRGLFQITGRWNYAHFGAAIDAPLEAEPDLASQPAVAARIACRYWAERRIGPLADADDVPGVTRKINGGLNGLADRQAITARLKRVCGLQA